MTELVAPFVPVHGSWSPWTFLPDVNCLLDPSGRSIRLCQLQTPQTNWSHDSLGLRGLLVLIYWIQPMKLNDDFWWRLDSFSTPLQICVLVTWPQVYFLSHQCRCSHSWHMEPYTHILLSVLCPHDLWGVPRQVIVQFHRLNPIDQH